MSPLIKSLITFPFRLHRLSTQERLEIPKKISGLYIQQKNQIKGFFQNPDPVQLYVGSTVKSARLQFEFLKDLGLKPSDKVLEIGCGALNASRYLIEYLEIGCFTGMDPNPWLRESATKKEKYLSDLIEYKKPHFLNNDNFDASELGIKYDFILSHSVLSHAAHFQLELFIEKCTKNLTRTGIILASIRLAEGNRFGSTGSHNKLDSRDKEWVYPGVSYFTKSTIEVAAQKFGMSVEYREDLTKKLTNFRKPEFHDWIQLTKHS